MTTQNPYVGPASIERGGRIYGRDSETRDLRDLLLAERILLLYAPSGAGKTSLIQAGLIPELEANGLKVFLIGRLRGGEGEAGNRYRSAFVRQVEAALAPPQRGTDYLEGLRSREGRAQAEEQVFIFDQFEEVLLDPLRRKECEEFIREVGSLLVGRSTYALFSMREDYIAEFDEYLHLIPTSLATRFRLGLLGRDAALEAIVQTAKGEKVDYAPGVAEDLVDDLRTVYRTSAAGDKAPHLGDWVEPVQLQVVCHQIWERRFSPPREPPPATITAEDVKAVGVDIALEEYYAETARAAADNEERKVPERDVREWIEDELIVPPGVRTQVEEYSAALPRCAIRVLEDKHLVRAESRGERRWYELAHDRLIEPIRRSNKAWLQENLAPLQLQAREWVRSGKADRLLLSLGEWFRTRAWRRAHVRERGEEDEFWQRSTESLLRTRLYPAVGLSVLIVGVGLLLWLWQQRAAAEAARRQQDVLIQFGHVKELAAERAIDQALVEGARAMTEFARLERRGEAAPLGFSARDSLLSVLRSARDVKRVLVVDNAFLRTVALHPTAQGVLFAYAGTGGTVELAGIDHPFGQTVRVCAGKATVTSIAFNPQGTLLAAACEDGAVSVWSTADWKRHSQWAAHKTRTLCVAFDKDGTMVASGGYDKKIRIMRVTADGSADTAGPQELAATPVGYVWSLAFSPTADLLLAGDGVANLWRCTISGVPKCDVLLKGDPEKPASQTDAITALAFSTDGSRFAAGLAHGRVLLWDPSLSPDKPIDVDSGSGRVDSLGLVTREGEMQIAFGRGDRLQFVPLPRESGLAPQAPASAAQATRRSALVGDAVRGLAFHAASGLLAAATEGGYVAIIDTAGRPDWTKTAIHLGPLKENEVRRGAVVDEEGGATRVVVAQAEEQDGKRDDRLVLVNLPQDSRTQPSPLAAVSAGQGRVMRVTASVARKRVATLGEARGEDGSKTYSIRIWALGKDLLPDPESGSIRVTDANHRTPTRVILSPDGELLVGAYQDSSDLLLVDLHSRSQSWVPTKAAAIREIAFSPDGRLLAAGGQLGPPGGGQDNDGILVWRVSDRGLVPHTTDKMQLTDMANKVFELGFAEDRDGHALVVAGGARGQINVWDAATGKLLRDVLRTDSQAVEQLAFWPGRDVLAAADAAGVLTLWDTDTWQRARLMSRFEEPQKVGFLGFARGGVLLAGGEALTAWDLDLSSLQRKMCGILGASGGAKASGQIADACDDMLQEKK